MSGQRFRFEAPVGLRDLAADLAHRAHVRLDPSSNERHLLFGPRVRPALIAQAIDRDNPGDDIYRKRARVCAVRQSNAFAVDTEHGILDGAAGDWLVTNHPDDDASSDVWLVSAERFAATYELATDPEPGPDVTVGFRVGEGATAEVFTQFDLETRRLNLLERIAVAQERIAVADERRNALLTLDRADRREYLDREARDRREFLASLDPVGERGGAT